MKQLIALVIAGCLTGPAVAQQAVAAETVPAAEVVAPDPGLVILDAAQTSLAAFQWLARPVVVFADTPADPRFAEQMDLLRARPDELVKRGVVVLTDTDPNARSEVRLKLRPRGFMLVLIDKDGTVNLRKPAPWDVRELSRAIDKMPLRLDEIRAEKAGG